jgi:hypothetical protein
MIPDTFRNSKLAHRSSDLLFFESRKYKSVRSKVNRGHSILSILTSRQPSARASITKELIELISATYWCRSYHFDSFKSHIISSSAATSASFLMQSYRCSVPLTVSVPFFVVSPTALPAATHPSARVLHFSYPRDQTYPWSYLPSPW